MQGRSVVILTSFFVIFFIQYLGFSQELSIRVENKNVLPYEPLCVLFRFANTTNENIHLRCGDVAENVKIFSLQNRNKLKIEKVFMPVGSSVVGDKVTLAPNEYHFEYALLYLDEIEPSSYRLIVDGQKLKDKYSRFKIVNATLTFVIREKNQDEAYIKSTLETNINPSKDERVNPFLTRNWSKRLFQNKDFIDKCKKMLDRYPNNAYVKYIAYNLSVPLSHIALVEKLKYLEIATSETRKFPLYTPALKMLFAIEKEICKGIELSVTTHQREILPYEPVLATVILKNNSKGKDIQIHKGDMAESVMYQIFNNDSWSEVKRNDLVRAYKKEYNLLVLRPGMENSEEIVFDLNLQKPGKIKIRFVFLYRPRIYSNEIDITVKHPNGNDRTIMKFLEGFIKDDNPLIKWNYHPLSQGTSFVSGCEEIIRNFPKSAYTLYIAYNLAICGGCLPIKHDMRMKYFELVLKSKNFPFYKKAIDEYERMKLMGH